MRSWILTRKTSSRGGNQPSSRSSFAIKVPIASKKAPGRQSGDRRDCSRTRFRKFRLIGQTRAGRDRAPRSSRVLADRSIDHSREERESVWSPSFLFSLVASFLEDRSRNRSGDKLSSLSLPLFLLLRRQTTFRGFAPATRYVSGSRHPKNQSQRCSLFERPFTEIPLVSFRE